MNTFTVGGFEVSALQHAPHAVTQAATGAAPEMRIVLGGSFEERGASETWQFAPASFLFRPAHHSCVEHYGESGATVLRVAIDPDRFGPMARYFARTDRVVHVPRMKDFRAMALRVIGDLGNDVVAPLSVESGVLQIIARVAQLPCARGLAERPPAWLDRAEMLLRQNLGEVSIGALAESVGVAPEHLSREFRRFYGRPAREYLLELRLEEAARLLRETELPLTDIALQAGFYDQAHMTNHFRRARGNTPREYRRR